jgi:glycosyltransferase involved in cell wall biosynthesis
LGERSASFANRTPAAREVEGDCPLPLPTAHWGLLVVETSVEGIAEGLQQMMALSDEERQEMGQQGCEWVKREFSWEHVAKQMVEAYEEGRAAARPCRGGINEPRGLSVGRGEL